MAHEPFIRRFREVSLAEGRQMRKPRALGRTMLVDMGLPVGLLRDLLTSAGDFVDVGKVATGSATLYRADVLARKLAAYREAGVETMIGGQFLEHVVHHDGWADVPAFFGEAAAIGFDAVEVSDNLVPLTLKEKCRLIGLGAQAGLRMHAEVGSKSGKGDPADLVAQARALAECGAQDVLFEAAEMVDAHGRVIPELARMVRAELPAERVVMELPGHWIDGVGPNDVYRMMTFLVSVFGSNVNVGNVWWDQVMILEAIRHGLAASGPLSIQSTSHALQEEVTSA